MNKIVKILYTYIILLCIQLINYHYTSATHISGNFDPANEFFKFIVKFGFQKTERHSQRDSFGYIYGNITSRQNNNYPVPITFAVLDKYSFLEYYGNRSIYDKEVACQRMFERLDWLVYDSSCNKKAKADYLRKIPCENGKLCQDEDSPANVVPQNQFTYVISDLLQPR